MSILRSRGMSVVLLVVVWLTGNQVGIWGQGAVGPTGPKKGSAKPNAGTSAKAMSVPPRNFRTLSTLAVPNDLGSGFGGFQGHPILTITAIDPKTPAKDLLPAPPVVPAPIAPWLVKDLSQVPEVFFEKPLDLKAAAPTITDPKTPEETQKLAQQKLALRQAAEGHVAHTLAKINHLNKKEPDYFVKLLVGNRPDLAGLPFVLGDACRMNKAVSRQFISEVNEPLLLMGGGFGGGFAGGGFSGGFGGGFHGGFGGGGMPNPTAPPPPKPTEDDIARAKVAAWVQIVGPAPTAKRMELVKKLMNINHAESTRALARLAVFSFDKEPRDAALNALTRRPSDDSNPILLQGLRYPWPAIAQNAADAIVYLKRRDLAPQLVDILDEPDPRAPVVPEGGCVPVVREVVRLNHHHNCITCHPPATSDPDFAKNGFSTDFLAAPVSILVPDQAAPSFGWGVRNQSPTLFLRIDVTFLRQDFSLMQKVEKSDFGPSPQRFDFLVRTREVTPQDVRAYAAWVKQQGPNYRVPHHQAAHTALRQLLGKNPEPNAAAWRKVLTALDTPP